MQSVRYVLLFCIFTSMAGGLLWAQPVISFLPSSLDFGTVNIGSSSSLPIRLSPTTMPVVIDSIGISGDPDFTINPPVTLPFSLAYGSFLDVNIVCSPLLAGPRAGNLEVRTSTGSYANALLSVIGAPAPPPPMFILDTSSDFGAVALGATSDYVSTVRLSTAWVTAYSDGVLESVSVTGDPSFNLVSVTNPLDLTPVSFPYGMTGMDPIEIKIQFEPTTQDTVAAVLSLLGEDGMIYETTLTGHGIDSGSVITAVPNPVNFGNTEYQVGYSQNVTISTAVAGTEITALSVTGDPDFSLVSPPTLPYSLAVGSPLVLTIWCLPQTLGPRNAILQIGSNVASDLNVPITANGTPPRMFSYTGSETVSTTIGNTLMLAYQLHLTTDWANLYGTGDVNGISVSGDPSFHLVSVTDPATSLAVSYPFTLASSTTWLDVSVSYTPTSVDTVFAVLNYLGEDAYPNYNTNLWGHGTVPTPEIRLNPNSLIVNVPANDSLDSSFQICNDGGSALNFTIDGSMLPSWITLAPGAGSIPAMGAQVVNVLIQTAGIVPGNYSYVITINSNDPLHPTMNLMITVDVTAQPLVADFHAVPTSGHAALSVHFIDDSTSDTATTWSAVNSWKWDFDNDGDFDSYLQSPTYTYDMPGTYSVRLVVGTASGSASVKLRSDYIHVQNASPVVVHPIDTIADMQEDVVWGPNDISYVFNDPDGDPLTYSAKGSIHLDPVVSDTLLTITPAANWFGTERITITAWDPYGAGVQHDIWVTVASVNDAPILSIPTDLYFLCNTQYIVDFGQYIDDPDNPDSQISISLSNTAGTGHVGFSYSPVNSPNVVGQLAVQFSFSSATQVTDIDRFDIQVNDNMGRLITSGSFQIHVIAHFVPLVTIADSYQYTGQTVEFHDATLGNPDYWLWMFGDGTTSTLQHPSHQYLNAGTYNVTLRLGHSALPSEERQVVMTGLIHLEGTAVTVDYIPSNWTYQNSPYNLYGDIVIPDTSSIVMDNNIEVNFFGNNPIVIEGSITANRVRFQPPAGSGHWGGFRFSGAGSREISHLNDCEIVDALQPIDIEGQSPVLDSLQITVSDTTACFDGTAIRLGAGSSAQISNVEILNYHGGINVNNGASSRETPVLTNIRIRNSSNTQREEAVQYYGVSIVGEAQIDNIEIDNFSTGMLIGSPVYRTETTPTLTNIRIRNSSNTQRTTGGTGMMITGDAAPDITGLSIWDVDNGLVVDAVSSNSRDTATLTNIRIRNSSNTQRSITNGVMITDTPKLEITDAEIENFATGMLIETDNMRADSTPTLTNIRIRNASNTQRTATNGMLINGSVAVRLNDVEITDYTEGLVYNFNGESRSETTPTLTNIRIRSSSNTQRVLGTGALFNELSKLYINDMQVDDYTTGMKILAPPTRETSTPTLTNIRIRNASNTQRDENIGLYLGSGVAGTMNNCRITGAGIGIHVSEGNRTVMTDNVVENCLTGIRAYGTDPLPLKRFTLVVYDYFYTNNPGLELAAFRLYGAGPWQVYRNTVYNYNKGVVLQDAQLDLNSCILWTTHQNLQPVVPNNSQFQASYNDIWRLGTPFPGNGNINAYPFFAQQDSTDFTLLRNSPCIDTGSPSLALDADGTVSDQGAYTYLHRASARITPHFVVVGSQVSFQNTSLGHDYSDTQVSWDIGSDGSVESYSRDFQYTFTTPGIYSIRLTMQSGTLMDTAVFPNFVIVSSNLLQAPQSPTLTKSGNDITLAWEPVTHTIEGDPISVPYYVVFRASNPQDVFYYCGFTSAPTNSFTDQGAALEAREFYMVIGFIGTREELRNYIESNTKRLQAGE